MAKHYCMQCGKDMGNEWIMGPVCIKCVKKNHRHVVTGKGVGYQGNNYDPATGKRVR